MRIKIIRYSSETIMTGYDAGVVASTTDLAALFVADGLEIATYTIAAVISVAVLLVGAGYAWRLFKRHITGRKL